MKTFQELSQRMGITKNQLSVILSDGYNPLKSTVEVLCQELHVAPGEIMDFSRNEEGVSPVPTVGKQAVTAIELFAGAGGLALGLEQAGIKTLAYVEIDKACCETLRYNRPQWNVICQDIHCVKPIMPMPNLPVARVMWQAMPDLTTGVECWITAGGAHHTVLSYDVTAEQMKDWATMMDIEFVHITKDTTVEALEKELFYNDIAWKLKEF